MIHIMKLQEEYFNYIKSGTKKYEIRLNDEKRRKIKIGDFIEFQKEPLLEEKIILEVSDLLYYSNFDELTNSIKIDYLSSSSFSKEQLLNDLTKFYSQEKQQKYGVVAIQLNKSIIVNNEDINKIDTNNHIFDNLRNFYSDFDSWLNKLKSNNERVYYTQKDNHVTSILIIKEDEKDSKQFLELGKILKIRTFCIDDKKKGIGSFYLKLTEEIASKNNIDFIYLTMKKDNSELICFLEKRNYEKYRIYKDEYVYYKSLKK